MQKHMYSIPSQRGHRRAIGAKEHNCRMTIVGILIVNEIAKTPMSLFYFPLEHFLIILFFFFGIGRNVY